MDLDKLMQQAQAMQSQMQRLQDELARRTVSGTSAGGLVTVEVDGKGNVQRVRLDPQVVDPSDVAGLEDLITVAARDAQARAQALEAEEMGQAMGGMQLPPGLSL
jgi:hypothetical protein